MATRRKTANTAAPDANGEAAPKPNPMATLPELRRQLEEVQPFVNSLARQIEELSLAALQGDPGANAKVAELDKDRAALQLKRELLLNAVRELEAQEQERERAAKLDRMTRRNAQGVKTLGPILMDDAPKELPRERFDKLMMAGTLQDELRRQIETFYSTFPKHLEANEARARLEKYSPYYWAVYVISNMVVPQAEVMTFTLGDLAHMKAAQREQEKAERRRASLIDSLAQELLLRSDPIPKITPRIEKMLTPRSQSGWKGQAPWLLSERSSANRPVTEILRELESKDAELRQDRAKREAEEQEDNPSPNRGAPVFGNAQTLREAAE